jgi:L-threonylcarbamoyladenylate synthase
MNVVVETVHLDAARPEDVERAAALLREGRLVAFATETVYGLGANALEAEAVAGIFAAKMRPGWDPLIVHVASVAEIGRVAVVEGELRERVRRLAAAFWPGPLTLLLPRGAAIPDAVTAGRPLVGVRVPGHPAAQALLRAAGLPIAAPSANLFGHTSPTTAEHVLADLGGRIDAVLDAGPTQVGVESTVVDVTQSPMVLYRPGAVSAEELERVSGVRCEVYVAAADAAGQAPSAMPSPGVGIRHYAPRARVVLTEGTEQALRRALLEANGAVGVMLPEGWTVAASAVVWRWGAWERAEELAAGLYAGLRALDERGVDVIVCPVPEGCGVFEAIRDRLLKAAKSAS